MAPYSWADDDTQSPASAVKSVHDGPCENLSLEKAGPPTPMDPSAPADMVAIHMLCVKPARE